MEFRNLVAEVMLDFLEDIGMAVSRSWVNGPGINVYTDTPHHRAGYIVFNDDHLRVRSTGSNDYIRVDYCEPELLDIVARVLRYY